MLAMWLASTWNKSRKNPTDYTDYADYLKFDSEVTWLNRSLLWLLALCKNLAAILDIMHQFVFTNNSFSSPSDISMSSCPI
jgi:hypothetical protein